MRPLTTAFLAAVATVALLASDATAATVAQWTFDTDRQDWGATYPSNTGTASIYQSTGGNPGGYLRATDRQGYQGAGPWYFDLVLANPDYSAAVGGSLTFDLKSFSTPGTAFSATDVQLSGGGLTLVIDASVQPTADWATVTIPLTTSAGWREFNPAGPAATQADFQAVLGALFNLRIRGDFTTGQGTTLGSAGFDVTGLDNVRFNSPAGASAVPLPPAAWGGLALLGGLGATKLRRRKAAATLA